MLTPICELQPVIDENNPIGWQFTPTSYLDQNKVGLHAGRLAWATRIAGFGGIIVKDYQGERSSFNAESQTIGDPNFDGSVAGTVSGSVTKAETERVGLENSQANVVPPYDWPTAVVEINRAEVASRISSSIQQGVTQEKAWALELDRSLGRGLARAAFKKLREDMSTMGEPWFTSGFLISTLGYRLSNHPGDWVGTGFGFVCASILMSAVDDYFIRPRNNENSDQPSLKRRLSLFPFKAQPDRFVLAAGYVLSHKMVDCID